MSNHYNSTSNDPQHPREHVDGLGLNHPAQTEHNLLSPYNSHLHSTTTSPSYNINSTPGESISDWSEFQPSEFSDDPFFGVDIDPSVNRVDSLSSTLFNQAYQSLQDNHPLQTTTTAIDTVSSSEPLSASSTYPLSPLPSTSPNTPSPKFGFSELRTRTTVSPHELNTNIHTTQQVFVPVGPPPAQKLTPDHSGTSNSSGGSTDIATMQQPIESPRISVSQWESMAPQEQNTQTVPGGRKRASSASAGASSGYVNRDDQDGSWQLNAATGQAGLDPAARQAFSGITIPTLKEQEKARELENANQNILEWQAKSETGSVRGGDEQPGQSYFPHPPDRNIWETHSTGHIDSEEDNVDPVDDTASIRENKLQEGQTYYNYNFEGKVPNGIDLRLMYQSRHWSDAPAVPRIIEDSAHFQQPATSNEAMMRWNREADVYSLASRAATWGTRRRSEPSLADWDGVTDGSFLKKLSLSKSREPGRPRNNSILDRGLDQLAKITRKKSDSRMKRSHSAVNVNDGSSSDPRKNSQESLAPPRTQFHSASTPNVNNTIAAMGAMAAIGTGHARSGSVSGPSAQPKSPLLGVKSFIKRARSKSELTSQEKAQSGIAGMWQRSGGPPVAVPASVPAQEPLPLPVSATGVTSTKSSSVPKAVDLDDEEEDEDDLIDEDDIKVEEEEETDPIIPNYEGFKAHIRRLNPDMDSKYNWLVSRVAHQQEVRYKNLLNLRVKHQKDVALRNCAAGQHCVALGGSATLIDAKGHPRQPEAGLGLQIITDLGNESDSNPGEGALTDETFPQGVPKPPTKNLPAEFECQLCFKAKKFQKPSDWTKHVHEDVQPFTCTYDKCKESKSFKRKADWVRHENERHRHLEWWICQVDDCKHPCYRKDNFLQHLVREHKLPEPKHKTKAAVKKTRNTEIAWVMLDQCHHETTNRPQDEPCKFCGKTFATWKKLTVHLAKHMEHISLPILKLVEARVVDVDTIISPVEGIITPVTPIGRSGIDSSPYNLNNVSPHNTMGTGFHHVQYTPAQFYHQPVSQPFLPSQPLVSLHNDARLCTLKAFIV